MNHPPTKDNPICSHGRDTWADDCGMCDASSTPPIAMYQPTPPAQPPMKLVIVMRTDLNMRKGKMVAQGGHAVEAVLIPEGTKVSLNNPGEHDILLHVPVNTDYIAWRQQHRTKICLGIGSEGELTLLYAMAKMTDIPVALVVDNGVTEFKGVKTITCMAFGPGPAAMIDTITGELDLL